LSTEKKQKEFPFSFITGNQWLGLLTLHGPAEHPAVQPSFWIYEMVGHDNSVLDEIPPGLPIAGITAEAASARSAPKAAVCGDSAPMPLGVKNFTARKSSRPRSSGARGRIRPATRLFYYPLATILGNLKNE